LLEYPSYGLHDGGSGVGWWQYVIIDDAKEDETVLGVAVMTNPSENSLAELPECACCTSVPKE